MPCKDYTTKLLDMEHMEIKNVEVYTSQLILYSEINRRLSRCPCCRSDRIHDCIEQTVKDWFR